MTIDAERMINAKGSINVEMETGIMTMTSFWMPNVEPKNLYRN